MWHNLFICATLHKRLIYQFPQVGRLLAYMSCSMITWAATPNECFASFWSSSRKYNNFGFAGLKTSLWKLCFAVAVDWGFTYFLRNTVRIFSKFSLLRLLMFLNVYSASPCMREWKWFFSLLPWVDCGFSNLFGTSLPTVWISLTSRQKSALSLWVI